MTSTSKRILERRARSLELSQRDTASRCTFCRRALPTSGVVILLTPNGSALRYCDQDCRQDQADALHTLEARR